MDRETFKTIESHMLKCMEDPAHDPQHIYRVLTQAMKIAEHHEADEDILIAACLLHDIGREAQFRDPEVCHALAGGEMAYDFLRKLGWSKGKAAAVKHCVQTHRFRRTMQPETIEAKILFDADKLDVTGAIGIARTLEYQGRTHQPLYSVDEQNQKLEGSAEEPPSFFREYNRKLKHLYDGFYTEEAKQMAEPRRQIAEAFWQHLNEEIDTSFTIS